MPKKIKPTLEFVDDGKGGKHFVPIGKKTAGLRMRAERYNRLVEEWVTSGSGAQAAARAGFSPCLGTNVSLRVRKRFPEVVDEIQRRRLALRQKVEINHETIVFELARLGFSRISNAITWKDGVLVLSDSDMIDDDTLAAIQEISADADGKIKLKMYDKKSALVELGKFLGMAQPSDVPGLMAALRGEAPDEVKTPQMDKRELARRALVTIKRARMLAEKSGGAGHGQERT